MAEVRCVSTVGYLRTVRQRRLRHSTGYNQAHIFLCDGNEEEFLEIARLI